MCLASPIERHRNVEPTSADRRNHGDAGAAFTARNCHEIGDRKNDGNRICVDVESGWLVLGPLQVVLTFPFRRANEITRRVVNATPPITLPGVPTTNLGMLGPTAICDP